jgi:hypothetical protein
MNIFRYIHLNLIRAKLTKDPKNIPAQAISFSYLKQTFLGGYKSLVKGLKKGFYTETSL